MSRKITIYKYEGNTDWSAEAEDSYGKLHHLGYYNELSTNTRMIELNEHTRVLTSE